jgi:hypothetical protein
MVMEELVEKLRDTILSIAECSEGGIVNSEAIARSVLSCIEEEGMVVVPRQPTEPMVLAAILWDEGERSEFHEMWRLAIAASTTKPT